MNKKIIGFVVVIVLIVVGVSAYFLLNNNSKTKEQETSNTNSQSNVVSNDNSSSNEENDDNDSSNTVTGNKTLVVYYSAQNHTKEVANKIANNLNADTFEITPVSVYTSEDLDWTNSNSRVSKEHDNVSLRDIKLVSTKVENWDNYDTVLIGYPIWWGIAAWPVDNFIKENDFSGKTVIPFCTSSSSGLGESGTLLEKIAKGGNWQEGIRFSSNPSDSDIKTFTDNLK